MNGRSLLGHAAEGLACELLAGKGYEIVERNNRCADGEIDIIARRGSLVVFCEVKARRTDFFGSPAEAVNHRKQARLRRLAGCWLSEARARGFAPGAEVRFDVVSVIVTGGRAEATHIPDAF